MLSRLAAPQKAAAVEAKAAARPGERERFRPPASGRALPPFAVLIGSDLRAFDAFLPRLDDLLRVAGSDRPAEYDAFVSTDADSHACASVAGQFERPYIRWVGVTPNTSRSMEEDAGPWRPMASPHHLHQWWRLAHAWGAMERYEARRSVEHARRGRPPADSEGKEEGRGGGGAEHAHAKSGQANNRSAAEYTHVIRLRTDLRLPAPFDPLSASVRGLMPGSDAHWRRSLVMRGDWIFWGARPAMKQAIHPSLLTMVLTCLLAYIETPPRPSRKQAILGYVAELRRFNMLGQHAYLPLPWRHLLDVGARGLGAGLFGWISFPSRSADRPWGFTNAEIYSVRCALVPLLWATQPHPPTPRCIAHNKGMAVDSNNTDKLGVRRCPGCSSTCARTSRRSRASSGAAAARSCASPDPSSRCAI